jgi:hypothetical protein
MFTKLVGILALFFGVGIAATNAKSLIPSPTECRQSTQYDRSDNTIVDCPNISCDDVTKFCKRRSEDWVDSDGSMLTVVYCSCDPISESDPFPGEVCHVYRWHKKGVSEPRCNNEGCPAGQSCQIADPLLTVVTCECKGT